MLLGLIVVGIAACGEVSRLPEGASVGPRPTLPPPVKTLIPTVDVAPAVGWSANARPAAAPGLAVSAYVTGLQHPRWLHVLPNGDVLVAESNAPPKEKSDAGIKGWIMKMMTQGWPVGVAIDKRGALLVADDVGNTVWRVTGVAGASSTARAASAAAR